MPAWAFGMFVWRELSTSDVEGSLRFYGELAGWTSKKVDMPNGAYHLLMKGQKQVGGLMALAQGADMHPYWMSYVSVPDVDASVEVARELEGEVVWGPLDVETVGRMATIVDPRGAAFSVMKSFAGDTPFTRPQPGEFCWEQLAAKDRAIARVFYSEVVGWKTTAMPGSQLETFGTGTLQSEQAATLLSATEGAPAGWLSFIVVDALGPACQRTLRLGGKVLTSELVVPGVGSYAVIEDPQGARLGLFT